MSNKLFDVLKWVSILFLPALAVLYKGLAEIWGLPFVDEIPQTLITINAFLGAILGISTIDYNKKQQELAEAKRINEQE